MNKVVDGKLSKVQDCYECLLVNHATHSGNYYACQLLEQIHGRDEVREFEYRDLRMDKEKQFQNMREEEGMSAPTNIAKQTEAIKAFKDVFREQEKLSLGIINESLTKGENAFAKNVTGAVAIGDMKSSQLTQLAGRLSRPCLLEDGDIVPKAFKLLHFKSEWASCVKKIATTKVLPRTAFEKVDANLNELIERVKGVEEETRILEMAARLVKVDEAKVLGDTTLAQDYLECVLDNEKAGACIYQYQMVRDENITYIKSVEE